MTPLLSDARLARQAGDGDRRAFAAIYKRYHQQVYRFCLSILGRPEDAQEALQNTMVKALRALPGERREIQLRPWLYRVAHNESIDLLRRRREGPELDSEQFADGTGLTETVASRERLRRLLTDLDELPERQRSALVMRELGGLDYAQIGAAFESSSAVARQTVYEARLGLRELETGREMGCEQVTRQLSEADGRVTRRRDIRAHLRSCPECRAFRDSIESRRNDLAALAPLPAAAAASVLHGLAGGKIAAGGGLGGTASAAGVGAGKVAGTSVALKAVATVAVVATVGVTAADRSGLFDVGLPGGARDESTMDGAAGRAPEASSEATAGRIAPTGSTAAQRAALGGAARARRAQDGPRSTSSSPATPAATENPALPQSTPNEKAGEGQPATLPEASRHGQETAAEHKATGKGKSTSHATPGSSAGESSKGGQAKGKSKSQGRQSHPAEAKQPKAHPTHPPPSEPPGKTKSEELAESGPEQGKSKAEVPEPSP